MSNNLGQPSMNPIDPVKDMGVNNKALRIALFAGVFIVLFVGGVLAVVFVATSAPTDAAEKFLEDLSAGNVSTAYEDGTSMGFKNTVSRDSFDVFLDTHTVLKNVDKHFFSYRGVTGNDFAVLRGTITASNGEVSPINIEFVYENNEWRILNLDLNPPPELADDDFDE